MRRYGFKTGLALLICAACTEPGPPISDAGDFPYRVTPRGVRVHGRTRILVVPTRFAQGAPDPLTSTGIRDAFFGGADGGPVARNFWLASGLTFSLAGEVTSWVQSTVASSELGLNGQVAPTREGDYVLQAMRGVDNVVDFGRYDNDGPDGFPNSGDDDGFVDGGIVVLNSDRNTHCGIPGSRGLHPHANTRWRDANNNAFPTLDAGAGASQAPDSAPRRIKVGGYVVMGVQSCGTDIAANVLTHELGHLLLGLPDLYHSVGGGTQVWEGRRWVVGCWELMAAGSGWGCGSGAPPPSGFDMSTLGAWSRATVGWTQPIVVPIARDSIYPLHPPSAGATILRVPVADSEYFLVEYRERGGSDLMPPANGVLIYHVDETLPIFPGITAPRRYRVRLMEADDADGLIRTETEGGDRGGASDAFGITRTSFATGTHSGALTTSGAPLPFAITEITVDGAKHRATVRIKPN
ncbi:MAG: immune inhibitor A domain-containing protein [Gemmatimonadaceae bacterium]